MWVKGIQDFLQVLYPFEIISKYNIQHKATESSKTWRPVQRQLMQKEENTIKCPLMFFFYDHIPSSFQGESGITGSHLCPGQDKGHLGQRVCLNTESP